MVKKIVILLIAVLFIVIVRCCKLEHKFHSLRKVLLITVLLFALGVRIFVVIKSNGLPLYHNDEQSYDSIALNLAEGRGYSLGYGTNPPPTAMRGPSYVLLLASIYAIFGHNYTYVHIFQIMIDCLSCLLLFRICKRLFGRTDAAILASFIYAIYPPFVLYTQRILTETFIIFLSTLSISLFIDFELFKKKSALYICAVVIGIAVLSKPILLLTPLIFYLSTIKTEKRLYRAREMLVQFVLIGLVMSPWVVRNFVVFHSFIPGVTQGGITFWGGTGPVNGRLVGSLDDAWVPEHIRSSAKNMSEVERDKWFYREGLNVIKDNPIRYLRIVIKKIPRLWFNIGDDKPLVYKQSKNIGSSSATWLNEENAFSKFLMLAILLATIGIIRERPPRFSVNLLLWLVIYYTIIHMVFFSVFRYSLPVYAYLFCFSAAGIASFVGGKRKVDEEAQP